MYGVRYFTPQPRGLYRCRRHVSGLLKPQKFVFGPAAALEPCRRLWYWAPSGCRVQTIYLRRNVLLFYVRCSGHQQQTLISPSHYNALYNIFRYVIYYTWVHLGLGGGGDGAEKEHINKRAITIMTGFHFTCVTHVLPRICTCITVYTYNRMRLYYIIV